MYGSVNTTALQPPSFPSDSQNSTGPYDTGYATRNGFGMFTMGGDDDDEAVGVGNGHGIGSGGGGYHAAAMTSSNALYNVPSYYQAGSYGGGGFGTATNTTGSSNYRVHGSRKPPTGSVNTGSAGANGGVGLAIHNSSPHAVASPRKNPSAPAEATSAADTPNNGGNAGPRSDYGEFASSFDYGDGGDFYGMGGFGGGGGGGGGRSSGVVLTARSGTTTATSIGDCHLSRKDDGGFTPQTDNTFLRSHGSMGTRSLDFRGGGDLSEWSDTGSAYDAGCFPGTHQAKQNGNLSQTVSDPSLMGQWQRRLSESMQKDSTPPNPAAATGAAQSGSGNSLPRMPKTDHVTPVLAPSPVPRCVPHGGHPPSLQGGTSGKSTVQRKRSFSEAEEGQTLKKSRSFNSYTGPCGETGCAPLYDTDGASSAESTTVLPVATAAAFTAPSSIPTPHASSSPPKADLNKSTNTTTNTKNNNTSSPLKRSNSFAEQRRRASQRVTDGTLLPGVAEGTTSRSAPSPSRATLQSSSVTPMQKADAGNTKKASDASPPPPSPPHNKSKDALHTTTTTAAPKEITNRCRVHVESPDTPSSSSSSSITARQPRTPPSRKPVKDKTTPPSRYTGTVLPLMLATVVPPPPPQLQPPSSSPTKPAWHESTIYSCSKKATTESRKTPGTTVVTAAATTSTAIFSPYNSTDTSSSTSRPGFLSETLADMGLRDATNGGGGGSMAAPSRQLAFTVAPPPSELKDPSRFLRSRYLNQPVVPLSATEVSEPVPPPPSANRREAASTSSKKSSHSTNYTASTSRGGHGSSLASSNMSPTVVNNLVGDGSRGNHNGGVTAASNRGVSVKGSKRSGNMVLGSKPQPPPPQRRRGPSTIATNIIPQSGGSEALRESNYHTTNAVNRHRSGSETHSLNDLAGSAQTRSCPSLDLSADEGTNPYLQYRSSSWSGHSTVCSSDSGDGSHNSSTRAKRQQDRMLPSVEEEMERYSNMRYGVRF